MPLPGKLQRQAAAYIAQPARLAERHRFGGGKKNLHGASSRTLGTFPIR
jgi:hypothetical protein